MKNKLSFVNKARSLVFVTVISVASLGGYVGYDQVVDYQKQLRNEGVANTLGVIRQNIEKECSQDFRFVSDDGKTTEILTVTTEECVRADYYDIAKERGELILKSAAGENMLLIPIE